MPQIVVCLVHVDGEEQLAKPLSQRRSALGAQVTVQ